MYCGVEGRWFEADSGLGLQTPLLSPKTPHTGTDEWVLLWMFRQRQKGTTDISHLLSSSKRDIGDDFTELSREDVGRGVICR